MVKTRRRSWSSKVVRPKRKMHKKMKLRVAKEKAVLEK